MQKTRQKLTISCFHKLKSIPFEKSSLKIKLEKSLPAKAVVKTTKCKIVNFMFFSLKVSQYVASNTIESDPNKCECFFK